MARIMKFPGKYVQGWGEVKNIGKHVKGLGKSFLVLISKRGYAELGEVIKESLEKEEYLVEFEIFNGECSLDEIERIKSVAQMKQVDGIISIGGGKAIDTGKAVATLGNINSIVIPTIASNDAPCSGLSVVYEGKKVVKVIFSKRNPDLVLVDSEILINSPKRYFVAGIGDALATYFEARACVKSGAKNFCRGNATVSAYAMAELSYKILEEYQNKIIYELDKKEESEVIEQVLEATIFLSGLGFESVGLAAAHAINDSFFIVKETENILHGEKVAFGTLCQLILENGKSEEFYKVLKLCKKVGLPTNLGDMGITSISEETLLKIGELSCAKGQSTRNMPSEVTPEDIKNAILIVDEEGRK